MCTSQRYITCYHLPVTVIHPYYTVIHPYYKLDWFKTHWGGAAEKEAEIRNGNPNAKDWHDEALKVVEKKVCV